jgi:uncharacterized protein
MKLDHDFRVDAELDTAWRVLLDLERIAPCMPGAQLQEVEGDEYRGTVKVKVGPITAQYRGVARIVESDAAAHKVVINAEGRDTRGQGNATATITATLTGDGDGTRVQVDTDLNVTGKVAQFGRGVMADVSTKLLGQFVDCLGTTVLAADSPPPPPTPSGGAGEPTEAPTAARRIDAPEAQPVDLMAAAGGAVAKRLVPLVAGALVVAGVVIWLLVR